MQFNRKQQREAVKLIESMAWGDMEQKERTEAALRDIAPQTAAADPQELTESLKRIPDLTQALHDAPPKLKRQVFEAFCLEIRFDKVERRIEISVTVSEAVAEAFENTKDLQKEALCVTTSDIAGAGFEPATFGL